MHVAAVAGGDVAVRIERREGEIELAAGSGVRWHAGKGQTGIVAADWLIVTLKVPPFSLTACVLVAKATVGGVLLS
jgi:hypothetical protein